MEHYFQQPGYYRVRIIPGQQKAEIRDVMDDGTIKIALTQQPVKGKANKELIAFVSELSDRPKHAISIVSGLTSRIKVIHISGDKEMS